MNAPTVHVGGTGSGPETISIVIPTYDGRDLLDECLGSIFRQGFPNFRVIVVDDGSTDGTTAWLNSEHPEVSTITHSQNRGFASAANSGLSIAQGSAVLLLNNDVELADDFLSRMYITLCTRPDYSLFAPKLLNFYDHTLIDAAGDGFSRYGVAFAIGHGQVDSQRFSQEREVFGVSGGAALYRSELLIDVGSFDPTFVMYLEDVDLSFRARLRGHRCLYVPTAIAYHRHSATVGLVNEYQELFVHRNTVLVIAKNMPGPLILRNLPRYLYVILGRAYSFARSSRLRLYLRSLLAGLAALPSALRARRRIQLLRRIGWSDLQAQFELRYPA